MPKLYRRLTLDGKKAINAGANTAYAALLPQLKEEVEWWLKGQNPDTWVLSTSTAHAVELQAKEKGQLDVKIVIPKTFNDCLTVGWGSQKDPVRDIADILMDILLGCGPVKECLREETEDEGRINFVLDEGSDSDSDYTGYCKGPFHHVAGLNDWDWSPTGPYQGYKIWEDYMDANDIGGSSD